MNARAFSLRDEIFRLVRYGVVGVFLMMAYLGLAMALTEFARLPPAYASPLSFVLCLPLAYLGQAGLVFRARARQSGQIGRFVLTAGVGFAIALTAVPLIGLMVEVPGFYAFLIVSILVPLSNFLVFRFWVFKAA